jgi:hypothetical protein
MQLTMNTPFKIKAPVTIFELHPEGAYAARLYSLIDLGEQDGSFGPKHQVNLTWETSETMADGRPFSISQRFTWSLHEKSRLRPVVEAMLKRKLTDDDFKYGMEPGKLVGTEMLLTVRHELAKAGDRTFATVHAVGPLPKGMRCGPAVNKPRMLWLEPGGWDAKVFDALPDWQKKIIEASPDFKRLIAQLSKPRAAPKAMPQPRGKKALDKFATKPQEQASIAEELDDEIPFDV